MTLKTKSCYFLKTINFALLEFCRYSYFLIPFHIWFHVVYYIITNFTLRLVQGWIFYKIILNSSPLAFFRQQTFPRNYAWSATFSEGVNWYFLFFYHGNYSVMVLFYTELMVVIPEPLLFFPESQKFFPKPVIIFPCTT